MPDSKKYNLDFRPDYFGPTRTDRKTGDSEGGPGAFELGQETERASKVRPQSLYGDSFLPGQEETEVEIARICLETTTFDIISVRARLQDGKIHYSVVDEYEGQTEYTCNPEMSDQPLTMAELIDLMEHTEVNFEHTGLVLGMIQHYCESPGDVDQWVHFANVSSYLYPQLGEWYFDAMEEWCEAKQQEDKAIDEGPVEIFIAFADQHELDPSTEDGDYLDEPVKALQVAPRQWRLEQNPSFSVMAAYKDTVEGDFDENDVLIIKRVVEKSGLRTIRAEVPRMFYRFDVGRAVLDRVIEAGGRWEFTFQGILVVNLPEDTADELEEIFQAAVLEARNLKQPETGAPPGFAKATGGD